MRYLHSKISSKREYILYVLCTHELRESEPSAQDIGMEKEEEKKSQMSFTSCVDIQWKMMLEQRARVSQSKIIFLLPKERKKKKEKRLKPTLLMRFSFPIAAPNTRVKREAQVCISYNTTGGRYSPTKRL